MAATRTTGISFGVINMAEFGDDDVVELLSWLEELDADALSERLKHEWAGARIVVNRIHARLKAERSDG